MTDNGKAIREYSAAIVKIVENGSALVDPCTRAMVLTHMNTIAVGTGNNPDVKRTERTHALPPIWK